VPVDDITIRDTFTLAQKLTLKDPLDWLALTSSNWIALVWKALNDCTVFARLADGARQSKKLKYLFWIRRP
jgi:hypothetical protein